MRRRTLLKAGLFGAAAVPLHSVAGLAATNRADTLAAIERRHRVRLGVAVLDTAPGGRTLVHRADDRFLLCSTGKLLAVAALLARVDRGELSLQQRRVFGREAVLGWAPITRLHVGAPGMTLDALCHAAITVSDNTAMNLLLDTLGGPAALTAIVRGWGDAITRFDRPEPALNTPGPGGTEDTTTPAAMLGQLRRLLLPAGNVLSATSRARLLDWLRHNTTGAGQLRGGLPAGWTAGDKTGAGVQQNNDVAIAWPPGDAPAPLLIAAYCEGGRGADARKAVLAEVGALAAARVRQA